MATSSSSWNMFSSCSLTTTLLVLLPLGVFGYVFSGLASLFMRQARSPLRHLRGPPAPSLFLGNLSEMHEGENDGLLQRWEGTYGPVLVYRGFVGGRRLMTFDPRAVAHILGNAYDYPKPDFIRDSLATMATGYDGLIVAEGEQHRRLRRILNPAFASSHIKSLAPIFWTKATTLRDIWSSMASSPCTSPSPTTETTPFSTTSSTTPIDVLSWLTRATLDAMGLAGFGYNFKSLPSSAHPTSLSSAQEPEEDELAAAFATIFSSARKLRIMTVFQAWFPILRRFRPDRHVMAHARSVMNRIGGKLIAERTAHVLDEKLHTSEKPRTPSSRLDRDLLSVMIRSSLAEEPSKRLSQDEALCQISTFLVAGHETTSNALSWALYALAGAPTVQSKLRAELRSLDVSLSSGEPSEEDVEAIMRLPYLDAVVREVLRLHAPVTSTMRVCAVESDVVPVSVPFMDKHGREQTSIQLAKGDIISVPLQALNKSVQCWGPDAELFLPERWLEGPPKDVEAIPGLWSRILTFGNNNFLNGNRSCIGWKFALLEIKLFIFALVRDLDFGIEQGIVIDKRVNVVTRPFVKGKESEGNQMPLLITRAASSSDLESVPSTPVL